MTTTNIDITKICQQRRRRMLYTLPPARIDIVSPYPTYTQQQLDMRRKAEILKYSANSTNTKTNNLTKAQKWVQLVSGQNQLSSYTTIITSTYDKNNSSFGNPVYITDVSKVTIVDCSSDNMIPTPTSSSGIPGPIMYLVRDLTIPLYNYTTNIDSYSQLPTVQLTQQWETIINNDISFIKDLSSTLFSLYILPTISQPSYTYSFSTPIGMYVSGTNISSNSGINLPYPINIQDISFTINTITAKVYYNGSLVSITPNISYQLNNSSLLSPTMSFDISFNAQSTSDSYSAFLYIGILTVSNILLYTQPGYVYDIDLIYDMTFTTPILSDGVNIYNEIFNTTSYSIISNLSSTNNIKSNNCNINSLPSTNLYKGFTLTGQ